MRNSRTMKVAYWVNVSKSYGAHLPGLSQINVHLNSCCVVVVLWH